MFKGKYDTRLSSKDPLDVEIDTFLVSHANRSEYIRQATRLRFLLEKNGMEVENTIAELLSALSERTTTEIERSSEQTVEQQVELEQLSTPRNDMLFIE